MKHQVSSICIWALFQLGCGDAPSTAPASAVGSQGGPKLLLSVEHRADTPRGALQATADGWWLYTSMDACRYIEGQFDATSVAEIEQWLSDESLKQYATQEPCAPEQYSIGSETKHACVAADVKSEGGKALIQLFQQTHDKLMWDGVQRECKGSGPGKLTVSNDPTKPKPKPPVAEAGAGGT